RSIPLLSLRPPPTSPLFPYTTLFRSRRDSNPLAFDKPTLLTLVVASLLLTETFSGALRYYFDMAGVSWLLYLPKVACLIALGLEDRKSTRLNSSHVKISYAVFCLKKK